MALFRRKTGGKPEEQLALAAQAQTFQNTESLIELAGILSRQNDFAEILRIVALKAAALVNADVASIVMINPRTQNTVKTIMREGKEISDRLFQFMHSNVSGAVMKSQQSLLIPEVKADSRFNKIVFKETDIRSLMCVPFRSEGIIVGCLLVVNKNGERQFDEAALALLEKFAAIAAPFISNVQKLEAYFVPPLPDASLLPKYAALGLFGKSKAFAELLKAIESATRCEVRVLLEGQSGTGKELIARAIHRLSVRNEHPFIAIDCGAIPANLIESELFGHVKGAFTGATHDRKGLFEEADCGTLFMDEVTNLPGDVQAKLLRVLQEGEIRPVGSNKSRKVEVRIISASSTSLRKLVDQNKFREDLFYRLHVYPIYVPTLNERQDDIPLLANHFLQKFMQQQQKQAKSFQGAMLNFMKHRKWAGNIRELENFVERLMTLASPETSTIDRSLLPKEYQREFKKIAADFEIEPVQKSLQDSLADFEEQLLRKVLAENDWNQSQAARVLQISEGTMRYKIEKLGIVKPE
ncbi:MAG: Anaerobic nitric oxide reductase transcription regulator NorR [Syntrophorhabdaceae bacterium]|nr:Anaerobic nitric oxide reductase transcription regulator NorR [Syntrophorhabdaceae bacterium]